jgi:hypothetical protein
MHKEWRFPGQGPPAEPLTPRLVAAVAADGRASVTYRRAAPLVCFIKINIQAGILPLPGQPGPEGMGHGGQRTEDGERSEVRRQNERQPGGRKRDPKREVLYLGTQSIAQPFMGGDRGKKQYLKQERTPAGLDAIIPGWV